MSGFQGANEAEGGIGFTMGTLANQGSQLMSILSAEDIVPGVRASYQLCKTIYVYHPLGGKLVDTPIKLAQSQKRDITITGGPENMLLEAFNRVSGTIGGKDLEGSDISTDAIVANHMRTKYIYGLGTLVAGERGKDSNTPLNLNDIKEENLFFNVCDPLNTAGSLVLDQDPNSPDFQKPKNIAVAGQPWHNSRCVVLMNEAPIYLDFTNSGFGFVGRSMYQRALFALKTFLQTMITDQYVSVKIGLLIAKMKPPGPVANNRILNWLGIKRQTLKGGFTGNVLSIGIEEEIESLNFQNLEGPAKMVRDDSLKNIAMAAGQPSKLLEQEEMIGGMAEGTEDAKAIAHFIDDVRKEMDPTYRFLDRIVRRVAWTPEFYKTVQAALPEQYGSKPYETAFYEWENSFKAEWPNLLEEPDSEKMKAEEIRFKSAVAVVETILPAMDPENKAEAIGWLQDEVNSRRELFSSKLELDIEKLKAYVPPQPLAAEGGGKEPQPKPFSAAA